MSKQNDFFPVEKKHNSDWMAFQNVFFSFPQKKKKGTIMLAFTPLVFSLLRFLPGLLV